MFLNIARKSYIKRWCEALRSGKYKQGAGCLQLVDEFCCLGVACHVFIPAEKLKLIGNREIAGYLPNAQPHAPRWLKEIDGDFTDRTDESLATLNDHNKLTFDEIADCLEAVYLHKVLG